MYTALTLIAIGVGIVIWKDDIVNHFKNKKVRKYHNSDLYRFQRAKIKYKMVKYYTDLGYIEPEFFAEEAVKNFEINNEIDKLYKEHREELIG